MNNAKATTKTIGYGFASWAIPFVVSLMFFERGGQPRLPIELVKSIMIVIGAASGGVLVLLLFRQIRPSLFRGTVIGSLWFVVNIVLDLGPDDEDEFGPILLGNRHPLPSDPNNGRFDGGGQSAGSFLHLVAASFSTSR
jgi:hypothetical protein